MRIERAVNCVRHRLLPACLLFVLFSLLITAHTLYGQRVTEPPNRASRPIQASATNTATATNFDWKLTEQYRQSALYGKFPAAAAVGDHEVVGSQVTLNASSPQDTTSIAFANEWWMGTFQSNRSGNWEIYSSRGDGTDLRQLTFGEAVDAQPQLNKSVDSIVFVSERDGNAEIYRMAVDGSNQTRLTSNTRADIQPTWSPDGQAITFVAAAGDADFELYQMQADGSGLRQLTDNNVDDLFPSWSPDGSQLVWVQAVGQSGWLWVMNRDGGNAHAISGALRYLQHPLWSPDGSRIAFDYDADEDGYNEVAILTLADGNLQTVQDAGFDFPPRPGFDLWLNAWSPLSDGLTYSVLEYFWQPVGDGSYRPVLQSINITGMCIIENCLGGGFGVPPSHSIIWNANASIRSRDTAPPRVSVQTLPHYQRRDFFFVRWSGADRGISGIANYDVQVKTNLDPTWQTWLQQTYKTGESVDLFRGGLLNATTVYFRSRATDNAGNVEPWQPSTESEAQTTLFATTVQGQLTDARGIPRSGETLAVLPAAIESVTTDQVGRYFARLPLEGEYQVNNVRVNANTDLHYSFYTAPRENLLANGDFEASSTLGAWQAGGTMTPIVTRTHVYQGGQSVRLGSDCAIECITIDNTMPLPTGYTLIPITSQDDQRHFMARYHDHSKLLYLVRHRDGTWSTPETILNSPSSENVGVGDSEGNLHLFWQVGFDQESQVIYLRRNAAGTWEPPVGFGQGRKPQVAMGKDGRVHLLAFRCTEFCNEQFLLYYQLDKSGAVLMDRALPVGITYDDAHQIALTADNTIHLVWLEIDETYIASDASVRQLLYRTVRNGAFASERTVLVEQSYISQAHLVHTADDTLHLIWDNRSWMQKPLNKPWSLPEVVANDRSYVFTDAAGALHLLISGGGTRPWQYRMKPGADQPWSLPKPVTFDTSYFSTFLLDADQHFGAVTGDAYFYHTPAIITAATSTIAQRVAIPVSLHRPTLSWMAAIDTPANALASFQVGISSAVSTTITSTLLYSTTQATDWQLNWADLTPWAGQTVTVTFALSQSTGARPSQVYLDNITLGAWTTPVPQRVAPTQVTVDVATPIVITGENFMETSKVQVGDVTLGNVKWVNEQTLEATLPATLPPGNYAVTVTNPGGTATHLTNALAVGEQLYLPLVAR